MITTQIATYNSSKTGDTLTEKELRIVANRDSQRQRNERKKPKCTSMVFHPKSEEHQRIAAEMLAADLPLGA